MEDNSFSITPMNQQVFLKPGEVYHGHIKVINPADATNNFSYIVHVAPFSVLGESYNASLSAESHWTMISNWITIEEPSGTLAPNETRDVNYTITVPEDAPAGAQNAAIVVSQDKTDENTSGIGMDNVFEMASIIYAEVDGETIRDGNILELYIPYFSDTPKLEVSARLDNNGNIFEEATTTITARNLITGETILPTEEYDGKYKDVVIPETTREIHRIVDGLPSLGIVEISESVYYNGNTNSLTQTVLICPIWFIVLITITILFFVATLTKLIMSHRRKKHSLS